MKIPTLLLALALLSPISCAQNAPELLPEAAAPDPNAPQLVASIQNPRITELSGLGASRRYPGLLYAHNDSGDRPRVFLLNQKGETVATIALKNAYARDWEDMAVGESGVFVGDIGDNIGNRDAVQVYRFAEPELDPLKLDQNLEIEPQVCAFAFPGAARDAETLLVAPGDKIQILSKEKGGSTLFGADFEAGKTQNLKRIGAKIEFGATGLFTKLATAGDFSPDGRKLVVSTYAQLYEWQLPAPFEAATLSQLKPIVRALPGLKQCESVCYSSDGAQIFVGSEGSRAPLYAYSSAF